MNNVQIATALFDAFSSGNGEAARALCAADLVAIQNGGPPMSRDALIKFSDSVKRVVPDFRYENARRTATDVGFVEEHDVCGTLPDGNLLRIAACVVAEVRDGKIVTLREYLDTAAAAGLLRALAGARKR